VTWGRTERAFPGVLPVTLSTVSKTCPTFTCQLFSTATCKPQEVERLGVRHKIFICTCIMYQNTWWPLKHTLHHAQQATSLTDLEFPWTVGILLRLLGYHYLCYFTANYLVETRFSLNQIVCSKVAIFWLRLESVVFQITTHVNTLRSRPFSLWCYMRKTVIRLQEQCGNQITLGLGTKRKDGPCDMCVVMWNIYIYRHII
jgi:hypothetical protein